MAVTLPFDLCRGADDKHHIAFLGMLEGIFRASCGMASPKKTASGFRRPSAFAQRRQGRAACDDLQKLFIPVFSLALHAFENEHVPVEFDDIPTARLLVEVVDILGDDHLDDPHMLQGRKGHMAFVRFCIPQGKRARCIHLYKAFPDHIRFSHKAGKKEEGGVITLPDATRRPEVRNSWIRSISPAPVRTTACFALISRSAAFSMRDKSMHRALPEGTYEVKADGGGGGFTV
jgi:hypothetical protein